MNPALPASAADDPLLSRIEDAALNASATPEQRWLDGWLLRFNPGKAKRARCMHALADGRLPLADRLQRAIAAYRACGLPPIFRITPFSRPADLDDQLAAAGWLRQDDTRVMVWRDGCTTLPSVPARADPVQESPPAGQLTPVDPQTFAEQVGTLRGTPPAQRLDHARRLLAVPVPARALVMHEGTSVLACGQVVIDGDVAGLYDIHTAEHARRRGLAAVLCRALLAQAAAQGARHAYLQVDADNDAARTLYGRLGFVDAYAYHYRIQPEDPM